MDQPSEDDEAPLAHGPSSSAKARRGNNKPQYVSGSGMGASRKRLREKDARAQAVDNPAAIVNSEEEEEAAAAADEDVFYYEMEDEPEDSSSDDDDSDDDFD